MLVEAFDRVTVNARLVLPELPSATVALATEMVGAVTTVAVSSLVMVPVAVAVARVALVGADRVTVRVSSGSTVVSAVTATLTCWERTPGAKVMVPEVAV